MSERHLRSRLFMFLSCYLALLLPAAAWAWKPITHVYLAEEAREDLLKRAGLVQIKEVDFAGASVLRGLGTFPANPETYLSLRDHPAEYRAGVLGPDAYPDLIFGQQTIHPDTNEQGTQAWLELLDSEVRTRAERSFYLGFLAHAAGDMFGHTFVNHYSGGPFTFTPLHNATRHIVVEGYVGNHTPALRGSASYAIDTARVNDFIYRTMIDARRPRDGELNNPSLPAEQQRRIRIWQLTAKTYHKSLPGLFTRLRAGLEDKVAGYYNHKRWLQEQINDRDARCGFWNPGACVEAGYFRGLLFAYQSINGIGIDYVEAWIRDIDRGLRAWPATSTEVARALFMKSDRAMDLSAAREALGRYQSQYLCSMLGSPDVFCTFGAVFKSVVEEITGALGLDFIQKLKEALFEQLVKAATGRTPSEWSALFKAAATDVDRHLPATPSTSSQLNGLMGLTGAPALFDVDRFAPAYNTRAAIQFSFLDRTAWKSVLGAVGWTHPQADPLLKRYLPRDQFLQGFVRSLDDSNQWILSSQQRMFLTRDCGLFSRFFMRQKGDLWEDSAQNAMAKECGEVTRLRALDAPNTCGNVEVEVSLKQPAGELGGLLRVDGVPGAVQPEVTQSRHVWVPAGSSLTTFRLPVGPGTSLQLTGVRSLQHVPFALTQTGACDGCPPGGCVPKACGAGQYRVNSVCVDVGIGYWSPAGEDARHACSNAPVNAVYTSAIAASAECPWTCSTGYARSAANQCVQVKALQCGANEVMVGLYGRSFAWVDALGLRCARLEGGQVTGNVRDVGPLGGTGGEPFSVNCNPGEVLFRVSASNGWSTSPPNASWCSATNLSTVKLWCLNPGTGAVQVRGQTGGRNSQCTQPLGPESSLECAAGQYLNGLMVNSANTGAYVGHLLDRACR